MGALLAKVKKMSLSDVQNLANEVLPLVSVSMTNSQITDLLMKMLPMLSGLEIKSSGTCPVRARGYSWGDMVDIYGDGQIHSVMCTIRTRTWPTCGRSPRARARSPRRCRFRTKL